MLRQGDRVSLNIFPGILAIFPHLAPRICHWKDAQNLGKSLSVFLVSLLSQEQFSMASSNYSAHSQHLSSPNGVLSPFSLCFIIFKIFFQQWFSALTVH
jgi:hypothetical protein